MSNYSAYVQERATGRVHRVIVSDGIPHTIGGCELPQDHRFIEEHDFLELAMMGKDDLCPHCFAPVEEGSGDA